MQHISLSTQHYFHYNLNEYELVYYLSCGPSTLNTLNPVFKRELFGILLNRDTTNSQFARYSE